MNLIFLEEAFAEMVESARFYESKSEGLGSYFLIAVQATTDRILQSPGTASSNTQKFGDDLCPDSLSTFFMNHTKIGFSSRLLCINDVGPAIGGNECINDFGLEI